MRKLILQMQMSVDGYVSAAQANLNWQLWGWSDPWRWDEKLKQDFNTVFDSVGTILLSRKVVEEGYIDHWAEAARRYPADPHYAFAQKIVNADKVVLSNKLEASRWERTAVVHGDMAEAVENIKREQGGDILSVGGVGFASALVEAGVVDEFQFFVNPTAVGGGLSVFNDRGNGHRLALLRSDAYECGIVVNRYVPGLP